MEYKIGNGVQIRLLTDLPDTGKHSALEFAHLYYRRWECELAYDEIKNHLSTTARDAQALVFRSVTPDGVLQEACALFTLYNIVRGLMGEADETYDVNPLFLSFVDTLELTKEASRRYQRARTAKECARLCSQLIGDIALTLDPRPRRPRKNPRAVKSKMGNYMLKQKG